MEGCKSISLKITLWCEDLASFTVQTGVGGPICCGVGKCNANLELAGLFIPNAFQILLQPYKRDYLHGVVSVLGAL